MAGERGPTTTLPDVVSLDEVGADDVALVGGKGAQLGELRHVDGVRVPPGVCVTTAAFRRVVAAIPSYGDAVARLCALDPSDRDAIAAHSGDVRRRIESFVMPEELAVGITRALAQLGPGVPLAVRSSATAEDQPGTSFAGLHDTFLGVVGPDAVLRDVRRCWASLFTERAVAYRLRNGIDHGDVAMAVVVQAMVPAQTSGVLFTADPVGGNRTVAIVEAVRGLGDALVGGSVAPDRFTVRDGAIVARSAGSDASLSDAQVLRLVQVGRRIEAHAGQPQDVEWCVTGDEIDVVQARPITTLFPVPRRDDGECRVYISVGHQQMMTDAMKPLGLSVFQMTAFRPMFEAGGRLFVDATEQLANPVARTPLLDLIGRSDPLIRDALETVLAGGFLPERAAAPAGPPPGFTPPPPIETDPAIVVELVEHARSSIATLERDIRTRSGTELFDFVANDVQELKALLFSPRSSQVIMAAMEATWWLNEHLEAWLGVRNAADALTLSAPGNVTSEMGLALLDVADAIRPHPAVVAHLERLHRDGGTDTLLDGLAEVDGGTAARHAIERYLDAYGMRCVGEIDLTRPRWREEPSALVPLILSNVRTFAPGEAARRFDDGLARASATEQDLLRRLRELPDGDAKADETKRKIDRVRTFVGFREFPKYVIVSRYRAYKEALLREADRLVETGALRERDDCFFLRFDELREAVRAQQVDQDLIRARKEAFRAQQAMRPPRVLTSDGEGLDGSYRREGGPDGALHGLAVSTGTVEGRARVILDMAAADVEPGDILVTAHTDPSWSPLFVTVAGLVTEVGGLMTHGAVIAREYGLPAVVGVPDATTHIRDGQRIRLHGAEGYVELLP